ncbi:hypothetical protein GTQ34_15870 [Muricauda sp. JGD-17]|uniref:Uncharacterized protein n=1 Tax=Flagellimonas ochracea TaxID=2696472 RepID=A0A964TED0_9FLAO|nr:hypothetical protein [Allomuricauda ochracea]NAY93388.1 hypothetical protein [Allomuricauda ochracea]
MNILLSIVMLLSVAGGLYLATQILTNKKPPLSAANIHGFIGLAVLIVLAIQAYSMNKLELWIALGMLIIASLGGLYLVNNQKKGELGPKSAVYIHGIFAIIAIVLTLISIW